MRDRSRDNGKTDPQRTHDADRRDRTVTRRRALELGSGRRGSARNAEARVRPQFVGRPSSLRPGAFTPGMESRE